MLPWPLWSRGLVVGRASYGASTAAAGPPSENSPTPQVKSAATAALRALEAVADGRVTFTLHRVVELSELNTVLVQLSISKPAGDDVLLLNGSGFVHGQPLDAAVKATLHATNRVFETGFIFIH